MNGTTPLAQYHVSQLTAGGADLQWYIVRSPAYELTPGQPVDHYPHLMNKTAWKETMTLAASFFSKVLEAHGVEGYQFPWCPLCPKSGWRYETHLPAEMHYKKVYDRCKSSELPFDQTRETCWQCISVVGGTIRFNHADGELQVQRINEPPLFGLPGTVADLDPTAEGVWCRVAARVSVPMGPDQTRDEYPLLMCGRKWWQTSMQASWGILSALLSRHRLMHASCQFCASKHELIETQLGGKNHFDTLWNLAGRHGVVQFDEFWQYWAVRIDGVQGHIRYNHLHGAIDVCRGTPQFSSVPQHVSYTASSSEALHSQQTQTSQASILGHQMLSSHLVPAPSTARPRHPITPAPPPGSPEDHNFHAPRPPPAPPPPATPPPPTTPGCTVVSGPTLAASGAASTHVQHSVDDRLTGAGRPLLHFLWCQLVGERAAKLSDSLVAEGFDVRAFSCNICKCSMTEGLSQHVMSADHMETTENSLPDGVVQPHALGQNAAYVQDFGNFWFNHLSGEWGHRDREDKEETGSTATATAAGIVVQDKEETGSAAAGTAAGIVEQPTIQNIGGANAEANHCAYIRYHVMAEHEVLPESGYLRLHSGSVVCSVHEEDEWHYGYIVVDDEMQGDPGWYPRCILRNSEDV